MMKNKMFSALAHFFSGMSRFFGAIYIYSETLHSVFEALSIESSKIENKLKLRKLLDVESSYYRKDPNKSVTSYHGKFHVWGWKFVDSKVTLARYKS